MAKKKIELRRVPPAKRNAFWNEARGKKGRPSLYINWRNKIEGTVNREVFTASFAREGAYVPVTLTRYSARPDEEIVRQHRRAIHTLEKARIPLLKTVLIKTDLSSRPESQISSYGGEYVQVTEFIGSAEGKSYAQPVRLQYVGTEHAGSAESIVSEKEMEKAVRTLTRIANAGYHPSPNAFHVLTGPKNLRGKLVIGSLETITGYPLRVPERYNAKQMGEKLATTLSLTLGLIKRQTKPELVMRYFDIALKEANPQWRPQLKKAIDEIKPTIRVSGKRSLHDEPHSPQPVRQQKRQPPQSNPLDETTDFEQ
jgi:hypothetical protein